MFRNGLQPVHIIVLLLVILLVFGSRRLPDIARSVGESLKVFKKEVRELREDDDDTPPAQHQDPVHDPGAHPTPTATTPSSGADQAPDQRT